jgi:hypothetical protein
MLTKIYQFPDELGLLTTGDKGLFDIAFPKNFSRRHFYMSYSTLSQRHLDPFQSLDYYHDLVIGEFFMDPFDQITFIQVVERLPQTTIYRSGGFLKASRQLTRRKPQLLWMSSGGNQDKSDDIAQDEPRYSSIYGILPNAIQPDPSVTFLKKWWATGVDNPFECDFCSSKSEMMCLSRVYDEYDNIAATNLLLIPPAYAGNPEVFRTNASNTTFSTGSTTKSTLTTIIEENGYRLTEHGLNGQWAFLEGVSCMPDSITFSKDNTLGYGYSKRVFTLQPVCEVDNFAGTVLSIVTRDSVRRTWVVQPIHVDFNNYKLFNVQLLSAELSDGLFLSGFDLSSNEHLLFRIKRI